MPFLKFWIKYERLVIWMPVDRAKSFDTYHSGSWAEIDAFNSCEMKRNWLIDSVPTRTSKSTYRWQCMHYDSNSAETFPGTKSSRSNPPNCFWRIESRDHCFSSICGEKKTIEFKFLFLTPSHILAEPYSSLTLHTNTWGSIEVLWTM